MLKYFEKPKSTLIYVFRINDSAHAGCLKVGETTLDDDNANIFALQPNAHALNEAARQRINQYTQTAAVSYDLLYTESAVYLRDGTIGWFNDKAVHHVLLRSGVERKQFTGVSATGTEWFVTDLATVKRAIAALKQGRQSLTAAEVTTTQSPIVFRPEQAEAISKTIEHFRRSNQMLWNAKMRFGKTLSALQVVKQVGFRRTLILTHRPVVDEGWFEDFNKIFYDTPGYAYGSKSKGETYDSLERGLTAGGQGYVYFASMQDLRGSERVGGKFDKNDAVFSTPWNLIIVDEAHEGTQTALGKAVMEELVKPTTKVLRLSGTPFNLLNDFKENEIFTWDYVMEQRAKRQWDIDHFGDPNPYAELPQLNIYTYDLGRLLSEFADEDIAFNFREFFRVGAAGTFVHERDVQAFLNLLTKTDEHSLYPFANDTYRDIFRHTLWMLPGVKAARAMSALLRVHPVFQYFTVVNVAGDGDEDEENGEALSMVNEAIGPDPDQTRTITLSCGRLTTGVTVKAWTGVLMLSGSYNTAASAYMQTIFRVQSPCTINGRVKEHCYVFDFAPDRTLQVLATVPRVSTKAGKTTDNQKQALGEFLNFCPVISIEGSTMEQLNVTHMLEQLKKAYVERVVRNGFEDSCLYNDQLMRLNDMELKQFNDLKGIIGKTKAMGNSGNIDINNQGLTDEEYLEKERLEKKKKRELSPEEKARLEELKKKKQVKDDAISILRGISIRMPLLIYGADISDENTELTIDNFTSLIDAQSWEEFMPRGVTKQRFNQFKRYYDPEIFSAAGKRIRALARAADHLTIEERIGRIATIFATFRNPDKETVLTPWRVVNMHMADCLGGYCFFGDGYPDEPMEDPRYVDRGAVTDDVFAADSHLLEINSKSGLYPLLLAYNVYRRRLKELMFSPETLEEHQAVWDQTVAENIFVICKTPMAKSITRRTLMGFRKGKTNMWAPEDLINKIKNQPELFIKKVHDLVGKNMKIKAIVGNPPYNLNDGSGASDDASNPLYHLFVNIAKQLSPAYFSLIMPSKWMIGGKPVLKSLRNEMMGDQRLSSMYDYEDAGQCFCGQHIDGGVCYFLWEAQHIGKMTYTYVTAQGEKLTTNRLLSDGNSDIVIRDFRRKNIILKATEGISSFKEIVSLTQPFGIRKDLFNSPERYPDSNLNEEYFDGSVKIYGVKGIKGGARRKIGYVLPQIISKNKDAINKFKLFFTTSYSTNAINPPETIIGERNSICTETFLLIGPFETEEEQRNCHKYISSNFFKILLYFGRGTMQVSKDVFRFVPMQDFSAGSDIDWSVGVAEIDRQLYAKYGLTDEEVAFIERMIKPME